MKQTYTQTLCDITGATGAETIPFGYRGTAYEIDLSPEMIETFDTAMAPFIERARRTGGARGARKLSRPARPVRMPTASNGNGVRHVESQDGATAQHLPANPTNNEVRAWAARKGIVVAPRGRVSRDIIAQYEDDAMTGGTETPAEPVTPAASPVEVKSYDNSGAPKRTKRTKRTTKPSEDEIASVWSQGHSLEAVADAFKVSKSTARNWTKDLRALTAA